jgi:hypothetical protein
VPNSFRCAGQELLRCKSTGSGELSYQTCAAGQVCDAARGACRTKLCEPDAIRCDGANVVRCSVDGTTEDTFKSCSLTQLCAAGACRDIVCAPNTSFCVGKDVWSCGADGTSSTLEKHCASNQFCLEDNGSASCSATQCVPGAALCADNVATQCAADGSGPEPGGDDCAALGGACYEGECRDLACTKGSKLCDHGDVYLCTQNGTDSTLLSDCNPSTEYCDPEAPACRTRVCTPGQAGCDGTRPGTCDALGSSFVPAGSDCADSGKTCLDGSCKAILCTPGVYFCSQGNVHRCDSTGTESTLYQQCASGPYHCEPAGYCAYNTCTPNAVGCNGDFVSTCNSVGSGWASATTNCAANGKRCKDGACVDPVCTPNTVFCSENHRRACQYDGLNSYDYGACPEKTYCVVQGGDVTCQRTPCDAGATACLSEKLGTCASDGMTLASVTTDCGAQSKLCTLQGCAAQAVDSLGSGDYVVAPNGSLIGNEVRVHSDRTLTQIEAYLSFPASRALAWVVYEATSSNDFSLGFSSASTGTGAALQSSGPISYSLKAGKTYLIGVNVTGSFVSYYGVEESQKPLSFGAALGGATASSSASTIYAYPTPSQLYYFRLTTKP